MAHRSVGNSIDLYVATFILHAARVVEEWREALPSLGSAGAEVEPTLVGEMEEKPFQWDVNPALSPRWQARIRAMLDSLKECFSWSSKQLGRVKPMPPAKVLVKDKNFKSLRPKAR